jgi:putative membrane protein insertion efficiency factor
MRTILILIIKFYRKFISPMFAPSCRFYPTCSDYAHQSIEKHGALIGLYYSIIRISKCHPWHPGGFDPVKEEKR